MTVIEVLDKSSIENLYAPLSYPARRVIYIGRDAKETERECRVYRALFAARGMQTVVESVIVTPGSGRELETLTAVFDASDRYLIDLAGGDEVLLFLLGRAVEQVKPPFALVHYGSAPAHRFLPVGMHSMALPRGQRPSLSVAETVALHGGRIAKRTDIGAGKLLSEELLALLRDIDAMWDISRGDSAAWNRNADGLAAFEALGCRRGMRFSVTQAFARDRKRADAYIRLRNFLPQLAAAGLITDLYMKKGGVSFRYKSAGVHTCLCRAGLLLELKIYLSALLTKGTDGKPLFDDAQTGVVLDWDRRTRDAASVNEIDVLLTRGMIPVFISCKNGGYGEDELYKLAAVAARFGGRFAKKVLIATGMSGSPARNAYFTRRAADMGIRLIPAVHTMTQTEICAALASL